MSLCLCHNLSMVKPPPVDARGKMSHMPRLAELPLPEELTPLVQALGINRPALAVLIALSDGRPVPFSDLQTRSGMPAGTLANQLVHLELLGFLAASSPPEARRGRRDVTWTINSATLDAALTAFHDRLAPSAK